MNGNNEIVLVIPCYWKDAENLLVLLKNIAEKSSLLPQQLRISLSEVNRVCPIVLNKIKHYIAVLYSIGCDAKLLLRETLALAGDNRNYAIQNSTAKIIVCHDADDDIHPRKLEILNYFFTKRSDVVLITHWFQPYGYKWQNYDAIDLISVDEPNQLAEIGFAHYAIGPLMRGHTAFRRSVFDVVQFPKDVLVGEDLGFCVDVQKKYPDGCVVLRACLCKYDYDININPAILHWNWERQEEPNGLVENRTKNGWIENLKLFPTGKLE